MREYTGTIVSNREIAARTYLMSIECGLDGYMPGQFVMVKTSSPYTFLRRPFGIMELRGGVLALLYKVKGQGTLSMSLLKEGERVSILGPLGTGFDLNPKGQVIYVAGGTGLPPLISLYNRIARGKFHFGTRSEEDIPFDYIPGNTEIATEDGSFGYHGLVTGMLTETVWKKPVSIYACGPVGMLREISSIAASTGAFCQISLEERMACGFGVCSGCVVRTVSGNRSVCVSGPVFDAGDIVW